MDPKNTSFRVIFAIRELSYDIKPGDTFFRLSITGITKLAPLPLREAIVFDLASLYSGAAMEFSLENDKGEVIAASEMKIPLTVHQNQETEVNENINLYFTNSPQDFVTARIYLVFLNKGIFREKAKQKNISSKNRYMNSASPLASQSKDLRSDPRANDRLAQNLLASADQQTYSSIRGSPKRGNSPSRSTVTGPFGPGDSYASIHSRSPKRTGAYSPGNRSPTRKSPARKEEVGAYLTHLVDKHTEDVARLVEEHNALHDLVTLNRLNGIEPEMTESQYVSRPPGNTSPNRRSEANPRTPEPNDERIRRSTEKPHDRPEKPEKSPEQTELSADKLRERYDTREARTFEDLAKSTSPSKRRQLTDLVSTLEREAASNAFLKAEIENLKNVILNQEAKLKQYNGIRDENERLKMDVVNSEEARKDLHHSILETTNELKQEVNNLQSQVSDLIKEKEDLINRNSDLMHRLDQSNHKLLSTQLNVDAKENQINELSVTVQQSEENKKHLERLENALSNAERRRTDDQQNYVTSIKSFEKSLDETKDIIGALNQEKRDILRELNEARNELQREKSEHAETVRELNMTEKKLLNAQNQREVIKSLEEQREALFKQITDGQMYQADLQALIQQIKEDMAAKNSEFENIEKNYIREISHFRERISSLENNQNLLNNELDKARVANSDLKATISSLEEIICLKEDVNKQLDEANNRLAILLREKEILNSQIDALAFSQQVSNNRVFELEKEIHQQRVISNDKDEYILNLKKLILELREKMPLYIPQKGDPIDNALADYINSSIDPGQLRMLFLRESDGVYQFGSKKVYVKTEGGKVLIRVGGGFLSLSEFLDQNVPLELEKMARNDPVNILTKNLAVHKTIAGRVVKEFEKPKTTPYQVKEVSPKLRKSAKDY